MIGRGRGTATAILTKIEAPKPVASGELKNCPTPPPPPSGLVYQTSDNAIGMKQPVELHCAVQSKLRDFIVENARTEPMRVLEQNSQAGRKLAICGAGPSLAKHEIEGVDDVWACNSALTFLVSRGTPVTAAIGIDQSPLMLREWLSAPDVPYFLASSVDPELVRYLLERGREVSFFHSLVGVEDEYNLYKKLWPSTALVVRGFMVTSRVIGLASWLGYERIDIYGCDCAFGPDDQAHANGDTVQESYINPAVSFGVIDGREWRTRLDMLIGAVDLVRTVRNSHGRIRLIGDTLPVALLGKSEEFLDQVAVYLKPGQPIPAHVLEGSHG